MQGRDDLDSHMIVYVCIICFLCIIIYDPKIVLFFLILCMNISWNSPEQIINAEAINVV